MPAKSDSLTWWQFLAASSVGIIVTMLGFWLSGVGNLPARAEVRNMISEQSPYVMDRAVIQQRLESHEKVLGATQDHLNRLADQITELVKAQEKVSGKLETLLELLSTNQVQHKGVAHERQ